MHSINGFEFLSFDYRVAIPDQLTYTSSKHTTGRIGPLIEHKFLVRIYQAPPSCLDENIALFFSICI